MVQEMVERLEEETEHQRIAKAVRRIVGPKVGGTGAAAFPRGRVLITVPYRVAQTLRGQRMLSMTLNQLLRFKSVVAEVGVRVDPRIPVLPGVPLQGATLGEMVEVLAESLSGPKSTYVIPACVKPTDAVDYNVALGLGAPPDPTLGESLWIDADGWTGFTNMGAPDPTAMADLPFGPYLAASIGVAEVFKRLLILNFGTDLGRPIRFLDRVALTAFDYSVAIEARSYQGLPAKIDFGNLVVAGAGAGGTAALYALAGVPGARGSVDLIDPQTFGPSNLGRYLTTDYSTVHAPKEKASHAAAWLSSWAPNFRAEPFKMKYSRYRDARGGRIDATMLLSTVDTAEIRREIQESTHSVIGDAAVADGLYTVMVVYYGRGRCLLCKHPYQSDSLLRMAARRWGLPFETARSWSAEHHRVTESDVKRVAGACGVPYYALTPHMVGRDFDDLWRLIECGQAEFTLPMPDQAPTLPFLTTVPGVLLAAEVVKHAVFGHEERWNCWEHDLFAAPLAKNRRWRAPLQSCPCRIG